MTTTAPVPLDAPGRSRTGRVKGLDALRALTALYVVAYHCVDIMTASGTKFDRPAGALRLLAHGDLLGLFGYGHFAVLVFFVLSGIAVHMRQAQRPDELTLTGVGLWARTYARKRVVRIYPPLFAAIALTSIIYVIGSHLFPDFYGHRLRHPTAATLALHNGTWHQMIQAMVPYAGGSRFGADGALWSLGFEIWFYIAYVPLLVAAVRSPRITIRNAFFVTAFLTEFVDMSGMHPMRSPWYGLVVVAKYFDCWLLGAYLAELYAKGVVIKRPMFYQLGGSILIALAMYLSPEQLAILPDHLFVFGAGLWIASLLLREKPTTYNGAATNWLAKQASWAYSLYLVHLPVVVFTEAWLGNSLGPVHNPLVVVAAFVLAIASGRAFGALIEQPSLRLSRSKRV